MSMDCAYPIIKETIPQSRLGYSTNNRFAGFPPLMNDGRSVTASHHPQSQWNEQILQESGIRSNWQYRQYLVENGNKIMEQNFREASNDIGYIQRYSQDVVPPASSISSYPVRSDLQENYGREQQTIKPLYVSHEELNQRMGYNIKL